MKPNIIFILLDGARWDRLNKSKDFREIAKEGFLFTNITSAMPYTFGAMNVILTGLYGKENGVDGYYKVFRLKDSIDYLPEILQKNGYYTSKGTIHEKVISPRGFDLSITYDENLDDPTKINIKLIDECFKKCGKKPIFSFFQYSRIHTVTVSEVLKKYDWNDRKFYEQKDENMKKYDSVFLEAVHHSKRIKEFVEKIAENDNTILIFFTDHGTGVGERFGERNYGSYTYEETIRTFFLFIGKDIRKNIANADLFSTLSICPTLLDLCGIKLKRTFSAKSLAPLLKGQKNEKGERYTFSETGALHGINPSPEKSNVFCVKTSEFKLIFFQTANRWELYDLINDPQETNNLFNTGLKIEEELKEILLQHINR